MVGREDHSPCFPAGTLPPSISPSLTIVFLSQLDFFTKGLVEFLSFVVIMDKKKLVKKLQKINDFGYSVIVTCMAVLFAASTVWLASSCFTSRFSRTVVGQAHNGRHVVWQFDHPVLDSWTQRIDSGFVSVNMGRLAASAVCRWKMTVDGQSRSSLCDNRQCRSTYFRPKRGL